MLQRIRKNKTAQLWIGLLIGILFGFFLQRGGVGEYEVILSPNIAGLLAQGLEPFTAIHEAQEYTWQTLAEGYRIGMGQRIPNRLFWAREEQS